MHYTAVYRIPHPSFVSATKLTNISVNAQFWAKITHIMKVGKNNFRPPPQVESSVVRIYPKLGTERPGVSWNEWDGMLRICFVRKNKTLRASWLGTKEVLAMVERNYRVWCAINNVSIDDTVIGDEEEMDVDEGPGAAEEEEWGGIMDMDDEADDLPSFFKEEAERISKGNDIKTKSKKKKTRVAGLVREKIRKVLEDNTELADQRAAKCDENDFLRLLSAFNEEGIHFA
jgi:18S rRNA (adenine1779-N6/adenine1780-N6)-dimethyltransferase